MTATYDPSHLSRLFLDRLLGIAYPLPAPYPTDWVEERAQDDPRSWSLMRLVEAGADPLGRTADGTPFLHVAFEALNLELAATVETCQWRYVQKQSSDLARQRWEAARGLDAQGNTRLVMLLKSLRAYSWSRQGEENPFSEDELIALLDAATAHYPPRGKAILWARDTTTSEQWSPLHLAARLTPDLAARAIRHLLSLGAPKNARDDRHGLTALEWIERQRGDEDLFFCPADGEELDAIAAALR